jgi:outer membrane murein-binding lipoprotein Lpp
MKNIVTSTIAVVALAAGVLTGISLTRVVQLEREVSELESQGHRFREGIYELNEEVSAHKSRVKELSTNQDRLLKGVRYLLSQPGDKVVEKMVLEDLDRMGNERDFEAQMKYLESIVAKAEADRLLGLRVGIYAPPPPQDE